MTDESTQNDETESSAKKQAQHQRLRAGLEILKDHPGGLHKDEVYRLAAERVPLLSEEEGTVRNGRPAAQVTFEFQSSTYALAGWLAKWKGSWRLTRFGQQALADNPDAEGLWTAAAEMPDEHGLTSPDPEATAEQLASIIAPEADDFRVRRLGRSMIESGFGRGTSIMDPNIPSWSPEVVADFHDRYNEHPDETNAKFLDKLERQLAGAPDATIVLAAELITLHQLPLVNLTAPNKTDRIRRVLSWAQEPIAPTIDMAYAFFQGSWSGGTGAHTLMWKAIAHFVEFLQEWWRLEPAVRESALADPWVWGALIDASPALNMPSSKAALKYLAFPTHFLPIINVHHKERILRQFAGEDQPLTGDLDRDLFNATLALQQEHGGKIYYYRPPWREMWDQKPEVPRAWLIRGSSVSGSNLVPDWVEQGFVSLPATSLEELVVWRVNR